METHPSLDTLITTIATGRCGTMYLSRLLACGEGVASTHEMLPRPSFLLERQNLGEAFRDYGRHWSAIKAADIRRQFGAAPYSPTIYTDTSHVWGKSCLHPLYHPLLDALDMDDDERHRVVWLVREARPTVESLLRYGGFPSRYPSGLHFAMLPSHALAVKPWPEWLDVYGPEHVPLGDDNRVNRAALALWYWREIQRVGELATRAWPARVLRVELPDLNTRDGVERVFAHCRIPGIREDVLATTLGVPINDSAGKGTKPVRLTDDEWSRACAIVDEVEARA